MSEIIKHAIKQILTDSARGRDRAMPAIHLLFEVNVKLVFNDCNDKINNLRQLRTYIRELNRVDNPDAFLILSTTTKPAGYYLPKDYAEARAASRQINRHAIAEVQRAHWILKLAESLQMEKLWKD
jgi:hypothetical protein